MSKIDFLSFMKRKNLERKDLSEALGVNRASISQYINDDHGIVFDKVKILVGMGISPKELFGEELGNKMEEAIIDEYLSKNPSNIKINSLEIMKEGMIEILKRI
jgi:transcriptional regulator with XRE-family HTH domain